MHNFINVYSAVKKHCEIEGFQDGKDCFEIIAESANVSLENMEFYFTTLQNLGLIRYSPDGWIELTETGVHQESLFAA